ncbi:MAG: MBL fold metallo-hydrolase [Candidatus Heimdallarchaeota archaeon]|nr:MBL fold metallo-hydrolase [Candidatus Heimdallarchaeota archaeon]
MFGCVFRVVKVTCFGAAKEIGRSAILVEDNDTKILLDCGLMIRPQQPTIAPTGIEEQAKDLQGVILSHAHFDHSGYLPKLPRKGYEGSIHMTDPTKDICAVLWRDHLKIEGDRHWNEDDMYDALYQCETHYYDKTFQVADGITATFLDAGHILGSASVLLDWKGQLIFYTGDINTFETPYHDTNKYPQLEEISLVISEATNGLRDLPNREQPNSDIVEAIYQTRKNNGVTIIPTFALGRGQEIEAILAQEFIGSNFNIYLDGMLLKMNDIYRRYFHEYWVSSKIVDWCKNHRLEVPFDLRNFIPITRNLADNMDTFRKMIVSENKPNIILSTSGMLEGGPIHSYLLHGAEIPVNLIAISGYQVEGTIGRAILDGERKVQLFNWDKKGPEINIKSKVKQFSFSGHAQRNELIKMLNAINTKNYLFVHGIEEAAQSIRNDLKGKNNVVIPNLKEKITFNN